MKLCYIEGKWAYFTSGPIVGKDKQWGDDWNDAPYEHNAGEPYFGYDECSYDIVKVAFDNDSLVTPAETAGGNSGYSVEQINNGLTPWLVTSEWASSPHVFIYAGTSIEAFERLVRYSGGRVYRMVEEEKPAKAETRPCLFCLKASEDALDKDFSTHQPYGGGEVQFRFAYGSCKFDNKVEGTNYRALICDECAEIYVERMQEF